MSSISRCRTVTDEEILAAIDDAVDAGDVKINGHPAYKDIAEHCPLSYARVQNRCCDLREQDIVAIDESINLETGGEVATVRRIDGGEDDGN